LLHERAAARGMASATYVSVLTRSHLHSLAPLPKEELLALKRAVGELGAIGRNLNQIARAANGGASVAGLGRDEFRAVLKICEALRDHTKKLIKANTASWASGHAEPKG
jgi:Bacterial mobilisation protein (MobC)